MLYAQLLTDLQHGLLFTTPFKDGISRRTWCFGTCVYTSLCKTLSKALSVLSPAPAVPQLPGLTRSLLVIRAQPSQSQRHGADNRFLTVKVTVPALPHGLQPCRLQGLCFHLTSYGGWPAFFPSLPVAGTQDSTKGVRPHLKLAPISLDHQ